MRNLSIFQRGGTGNFLASFISPLTGKRVNRSTGTHNLHRAHLKAKQMLEDETLKANTLSSEQQTISWNLDRYIEKLRRMNRAERYVTQIRSRILRVCELGDLQVLDDLTQKHLIACAIEELLASGLSKQTCNEYLKAIKSLISWLYYKDLLKTDITPALKTMRISPADRTSRGCLSVDEFERLLDSLEGVKYGMNAAKRRLLYLMAATTGLRLGELSNLQRSSIQDGYICLSPDRTKNRKGARQPMSSRLKEEIEPHLDGHQLTYGPDGLFPVLRKGSAFLKEDLEHADIAFRDTDGSPRDFHSLRAYFITRLLEAGIPTHQVMHLARHATPDLTLAIYAKVCPNQDFHSHLQAAGL